MRWATTITATSGTTCDFCRRVEAGLTAFPCRPFETTIIRRGNLLIIRACTCCRDGFQPAPGDQVLAIHRSLDGWAACRTCAHLIAAGARQDLARHMLTTFLAGETNPDRIAATCRIVVGLVAAFWNHRRTVN